MRQLHYWDPTLALLACSNRVRQTDKAPFPCSAGTFQPWHWSSAWHGPDLAHGRRATRHFPRATTGPRPSTQMGG